MQTDYIYTQEYDNTFQLVLPLEVGKKIPDNSPVRTFCNLFQQISMEGIVEKKISHMGRKSFNQVILLKLVLYGYMIGIRSSREIKRACDVNIEFMYLLNGFDSPSHSTINTFINNSNSKIDEIFLRVIDAIMDNENINLDNLYIDGTKIEAFSNKYTFVWRGRIMHGIYGLMGKINKIWNDLEIFLNESDRNKLLRYIEQPKEYRKGMKFKYYSRNRLMLIRKALRKTIKSEKIEFVFGKGKRKLRYKEYMK